MTESNMSEWSPEGAELTQDERRSLTRLLRRADDLESACFILNALHQQAEADFVRYRREVGLTEPAAKS
jgi:hypothetical protein